MRWPQIRFTFLELIFAPQDEPEPQTHPYLGPSTAGHYEIAVEPLGADYDDPEEEFGFRGPG